ncbi:hypothetical protein IV203_030557 [Nitzschia inconspicua]|uniref:Uncharacterized protein n=1 Tax=Nitzschia inconspicua TaxID=303405 RepID=A0A9K3KCC5_9STRA|nr:hypothetical protein IV203_022893 [Nitzschia inconspicua]KAG7367814.1 hypothetical protein IV203_030557 [Nitzschia inconspicua]
MCTMNHSTSSSSTSSFTSSSAVRTVFRLNRIGLQHFHEERYSDASECFLSGIKVLKRLTTCCLNGSSSCSESIEMPAHADSLELSQAYSNPLPKSNRKGAILQPLDITSLQFPFGNNGDVYDRYTWVSFALIFNLASTMHYNAMLMKEGQPSLNSESTMSRNVLVEQALRLYQCAFEGVSNQEFPTSPPLHERSCRTSRVILAQRLILSVAHNMGLLLSGMELRDVGMGIAGSDNNHNSRASRRPSSHRCFQVVFATVHSLRDYYGIQHEDFPADFDLQLVINTALERLEICPSDVPSGHSDNAVFTHSATAPCA